MPDPKPATTPTTSSLRRGLTMFALIAAGEGIFLLPFVVARVFRGTLLDVFELTNMELGTAFSLYGLIAMASYVVGGPLADRFSARKLMAIALVTTALGGIVYAGVPDLATLTALFGFWGLTTILLFWAALIRATREWGGDGEQSRAFGILDGGRGVLAAAVAAITSLIFSLLLPADVDSATLPELQAALVQVIWIMTGVTTAVAAVVWLLIPDDGAAPSQRSAPKEKLTSAKMLAVLKLPAVWLQAGIVVCAYVGYKATDDIGLFAEDALDYDRVEAAYLGTLSFWMRPIAAVGAGLLGDRLSASRVIIGSFVVLVLGSTAIALGLLEPGATAVVIVTVAATSAGIFALRGIYFALFGEAKVPVAVTGTAVGFVSVLGYTPDVFTGPLFGWLLDRSPGALGHQHLWGTVAGFGLVGILCTVGFRLVVQPPEDDEPEPAPTGAVEA